jgi:hypothetical protein
VRILEAPISQSRRLGSYDKGTRARVVLAFTLAKPPSDCTSAKARQRKKEDTYPVERTPSLASRFGGGGRPAESPHEGRWERALSQSRVVVAYVVQARCYITGTLLEDRLHGDDLT